MGAPLRVSVSGVVSASWPADRAQVDDDTIMSIEVQVHAIHIDEGQHQAVGTRAVGVVHVTQARPGVVGVLVTLRVEMEMEEKRSTLCGYFCSLGNLIHFLTFCCLIFLKDILKEILTNTNLYKF